MSNSKFGTTHYYRNTSKPSRITSEMVNLLN